MQESLTRIIKIRAIEFPLKQGVILLELKGFADGIPAKVTGVRALFRQLRLGMRSKRYCMLVEDRIQ